MFLSHLSSFFRRTAANPTCRPRRRAFRPRLEQLEDRRVPSTVVFEDHTENGVNGWTATGLWAQESGNWNSPETKWVYGPDGYGTGYWLDYWDFDNGWTHEWVDTMNRARSTARRYQPAGASQATLVFAEQRERDVEPWTRSAAASIARRCSLRQRRRRPGRPSLSRTTPPPGTSGRSTCPHTPAERSTCGSTSTRSTNSTTTTAAGRWTTSPSTPARRRPRSRSATPQ